MINIIKKFFNKKTKFEKLYNSGIDAFNKKNYGKALEKFNLALSQEHAQPQVYYNIARTYHEKSEYDKAIKTYNKFIEFAPDDYDGLYNLALVYYITGDYENAINFFEKCTLVKQGEPDSTKALVLAYISDSKIQKAIEFCEKIYDLPQNGVNLYFAMAKLFETKNSPSKDFTFIDISLQMYSKIIQENPEYFDAYLAKSICHAKKGEWEDSVEFCEKAIEIDPKSYEANNQLGLIYYCRNDLKKAINYYEIALKLKPKGDYKIYSNLAYAYEKDGQIKKAIKTFGQLITKFPNLPSKDEIKNHLRVLKES